jgi:hypothetical protein
MPTKTGLATMTQSPFERVILSGLGVPRERVNVVVLALLQSA